jgi:hypothetical protein
MSRKQTTIQTLSQLRIKLYANAAHAIEANPQRADPIRERVQADVDRIAFAINMVILKM